ncbi:hypothetical protein RchiOBHm_Chr7g0210961 [Rosa chinensis]|uniref:Uncharacterized protein n=1 Tax=Rosa chinensis TaxID=74649 RepID=A0A2P6PAC4_ROSCH|nr:hypothetical protein RchiOBHm_Chr7g0210961 [Rosa chinensis]
MQSALQLHLSIWPGELYMFCNFLFYSFVVMVFSYMRSLGKAPVVTNCLASGMEGAAFLICFETNGHGL